MYVISVGTSTEDVVVALVVIVADVISIQVLTIPSETYSKRMFELKLNHWSPTCGETGAVFEDV